jgi:hypothetical protein
MNFRTNLLKVPLTILLVCAGCKENPTEPVTPSSSIKGTVLQKDNNTPIQNAMITDQGKNGVTPVSTDSVGAFTLPLGVLSSNYSTTLIVTANGYVDDTITTQVEVGKDQTVTIRLKLANGVLPISSGTTGQAASIDLVILTDKSLSVRNAGGTEKTLLTFVVRDSLGYSITPQKAVMVRFTIIGGQIGGEFLLPDSIETNANGIASTVVTSGTKSRVLQVIASATVSGKTISSSPAQLTISGGLPDSVRSTLWTSSTNFPGTSNFADKLGTVSVMLVDQYGNPVQLGNLAYFETTGGSIDAIGVTDATGLAVVNIYGAGKPPVAGIDTIKVTVNRANGSFSKSTVVTFSGTPRIRVTNVPNDTIIIYDAADKMLNLTIDDINGNPLSAGNRILVTAGGLAVQAIKLSGDINTITPDTRSTSATSYKVRVEDATKNGGESGSFSLQITVSGPNGTTTKFIYGILEPPQAIVPPRESAKMPAQIAFVSVSSTDIYVAGTGSLENSVVTYEVRDSLGMLIGSNPKAFAQFSLKFFPNTFTNVGTEPYLISTADSTDENAKLRISVRSGTQAGVIQVYSQIDLGGGRYVTSQPVKISIHAGFADPSHFTLASKYYNFPGLEMAFYTYDMTVQVADRYSNPVLIGTAVYFNTMHGAIGTGKSLIDVLGVTDLDGFVKQTLWSGNPYPEGVYVIPDAGPAFSWVYARTQGESATWVRDSVLMLWTGHPIITEDPANPTTFAIPNGGSKGPWQFTIADIYGHPMSPGTTITVGGPGLTVDGDAVDLEMPDTPPIFLPPNTYIAPNGPGITTFTVIASDADPKTIASPPTKSVLTLSINHPVYGKFRRVLAVGTVE